MNGISKGSLNLEKLFSFVGFPHLSIESLLDGNVSIDPSLCSVTEWRVSVVGTEFWFSYSCS